MALGTPGSLYAGYDHDNTGLPYPARSFDGLNPVFEEEVKELGLVGALVLDAAASNGARSTVTVLTSLVVTAVARGVAGDDITITIVDPGEETSFTLPQVAVTGTDIVVTLAEDDSAALSTRGEVATAINGHPAANSLVTADAGAGAATEAAAVAETSLANGAAFTPAPGRCFGVYDVDGDVTLYFAPAAVTALNDVNWLTVNLYEPV